MLFIYTPQIAKAAAAAMETLLVIDLEKSRKSILYFNFLPVR